MARYRKFKSYSKTNSRSDSTYETETTSSLKKLLLEKEEKIDEDLQRRKEIVSSIYNNRKKLIDLLTYLEHKRTEFSHRLDIEYRTKGFFKQQTGWETANEKLIPKEIKNISCAEKFMRVNIEEAIELLDTDDLKPNNLNRLDLKPRKSPLPKNIIEDFDDSGLYVQLEFFCNVLFIMDSYGLERELSILSNVNEWQDYDRIFPLTEKCYIRYELRAVKREIREIKKILAERNSKEKASEKNARLKSFENRSREGSSNLKKKLINQFDIFDFCPYCGSKLSKIKCHADHIYPVSKGGLTTKRNMILVCPDCNLKKSKLTLNQFINKYKMDRIFIHNNLDTLEKDY
jgi:5-methylcytosine-specific restriction endonuclease McrA